MASPLPEHPPAAPAAEPERWRALVERDLGGAPFASLVATTDDGLEIAPLYTRRDERPPAPPPGFAPYTRGATPLGAVQQGWDVRVERAESDPADAARALLDDLAGGATSVRLRLERAERLAGAVRGSSAPSGSPADGIAVNALDDLDAALAGAHLELIGVALDAGGHGAPAALALTALWERRAVPHDERRGELGMDPLGTLARDGALPTSVDDAIAQLADLAIWAVREQPQVPVARVSTAPYHDAGCTAAQEIGIALATGVTYLRAMVDAGLAPTAAARQLVFDLQLGTEQFEEIAKLRAFRLAWGRVLAHVGASGVAPRLTTRLARRVLTRRDPWVNMLRATVATFAGAVGGAEAIVVAPFDAALGVPDALGRRAARNTQHVLHEESHLAATVDPAGGSWFVESLTERLAERGWAELRALEQAGGIAGALQDGTLAARIDAAADARGRSVARRKRAVTGVSEFPNVHEAPVAREPNAFAGRAATTPAAGAAAHALARVRAESEAGANDPPGTRTAALLAAVRLGVPFTALAEALAAGRTPARVEPLPVRPLAAPFEALRDAADGYAARTGTRPGALLVTLGPAAQHGARATFTRNLLEAGGFVVLEPGPLPDADAAAAALREHGATLAVLASSDAVYAEHAEAAVRALRAAGARTVAYAGRPGEREAALREAGVDEFIALGADMVALLHALQTREEVVR